MVWLTNTLELSKYNFTYRGLPNPVLQQTQCLYIIHKLPLLSLVKIILVIPVNSEVFHCWASSDDFLVAATNLFIVWNSEAAHIINNGNTSVSKGWGVIVFFYFWYFSILYVTRSFINRNYMKIGVRGFLGHWLCMDDQIFYIRLQKEKFIMMAEADYFAWDFTYFHVESSIWEVDYKNCWRFRGQQPKKFLYYINFHKRRTEETHNSLAPMSKKNPISIFPVLWLFFHVGMHFFLKRKQCS